MISRSRRGSLVLDNQLTNVVNPIKEEYTTKYERLSEGVIQDFIESRLAYIENILNNLEKPEEVTIEEPKEEPKEEETSEETLEPKPVKNLSDAEKEELQTVPKTEKEAKITGYRAYGNVAFVGNVSEDGKEWISTGGKPRDIGIFGAMSPAGTILAKTGAEKRELVRKLNFIKSLFLYDLDIDLYDIPLELQRQLSKKALKAAKFYLVAEDKSSVHNLTGLTTLKQNELDFIPGKVISIQARVETPAGEAIITLGAVANPAKWIEGIENNPSLSRAEKDAQIAEAKHYEE